ncbi:MAG: sodium:calcium antiporter [Syntrophales bacterium]|nr:sodium:calcium antiporter [Syntrophales bacterium]
MDLLRYLYDGQHLSAALGNIHVSFLIIITIVSIAILTRGADWMVEGAVSLALRTRIPKIVIGATVISMGTTTPEAFVSVFAAWTGDGGMALGNGVGSIIADTGLIFGLTCILAATPSDRFILNRTGWVQVGTATLLVALALMAWLKSPTEPMLYRWVGLLFLFMLIGYMILSVRWARQRNHDPSINKIKDEKATFGLALSWTMIIAGLVLVITGARILIPCATETAIRIGVPSDVIAATMVALGTSLPELMTAISAIRKGYPEITVGNIVGADVLNCLFVIGASAAVSPLFIPKTFFIFHFPAMLIVLYSFRIFIHMNRDGFFRRWQGVWLLSVYVAYVAIQYAFNLGIAH